MNRRCFIKAGFFAASGAYLSVALPVRSGAASIVWPHTTYLFDNWKIFWTGWKPHWDSTFVFGQWIAYPTHKGRADSTRFPVAANVTTDSFDAVASTGKLKVQEALELLLRMIENGEEIGRKHKLPCVPVDHLGQINRRLLSRQLRTLGRLEAA